MLTNADPGQSILHSRALKTVGFIVCLSAIVSVLYCLTTLNRGLELTDESYYIVSAIYPAAISFYVTAQHFIIAPLWQLSQSVALFRGTGLFLLISGATILAHGTFELSTRTQLISKCSFNRIALICSSVCGALAYATTINLSPSYNLIASFAGYGAIGCVFLALSAATPQRAAAFFITSGFMLAICAFGKFTSAATTAILIAAACLCTLRAFSKIAIAYSLICAGFAAVFIGIISTRSSIPEFFNALKGGMSLFTMVQTEAPLSRLIRSCWNFLTGAGRTLWDFSLPLVLMILYRLTKSGYFAVAACITFVLCIFFGNSSTFDLSVADALQNGRFWGGINHYENAVASILGAIMLALMSAHTFLLTIRSAVILVALAALPIAISVGTGNSLFSQTVDALAPWTLLVALLWLANSNHRSQIATGAIAAIALLTTSAQILTSAAYPYNLNDTLLKQNRLLESPRLGSLKVDEATVKYAEQLQDAAANCKIPQKSPILGLFHLPGVALLLDQVPPISPWLNNSAQVDLILDLLPQDMIEHTTLAIQFEAERAPMLPERVQRLLEKRRLCGEAIHPHTRQRVQIWY